jgi:hypothetical protein
VQGDKLVDLRTEPFRRHTALYRDLAQLSMPIAPDMPTFGTTGYQFGTEPRAFFIPRAAEMVVVFPADDKLPLDMQKLRSNDLPAIPRERLLALEANARTFLSFQRAIGLWDMVRLGRLAELAQFIRRADRPGGAPVFYYDSHPSLRAGAAPGPPDLRERVVIADVDPEIAAQTDTADMRPAARAYLMSVINVQLEGGLAGKLIESPGTEGKMEMHLVPRTFLVALWFQFAQEVAGNLKTARCVACQGWFRLDKHEDRMYCSAACKVRMSRLRKKVREMHGRGVPPKKIAKKLCIPLATVERLLSEKEE